MDFKIEERGMKLQNSFNPTKGDVLLWNSLEKWKWQNVDYLEQSVF